MSVGWDSVHGVSRLLSEDGGKFARNIGSNFV